jgi:type VI secretion system secreted protein Hcp
MPIQIDGLSTAATGAGSDADIHLDVQGRRAGKIKGEGVTEGHVDDIQLHGWHWGVAAASAIGSGTATSRRQFRPLVVVKRLDASTTGLLNALAKNDELKTATLTMRKAGGPALDYFKMILSGARVVDVGIDVDADGRPIERVTLAFVKIEIDYRRQQDDGSGAGACSYTDEVMSTQ